MQCAILLPWVYFGSLSLFVFMSNSVFIIHEREYVKRYEGTRGQRQQGKNRCALGKWNRLQNVCVRVCGLVFCDGDRLIYQNQSFELWKSEIK